MENSDGNWGCWLSGEMFPSYCISVVKGAEVVDIFQGYGVPLNRVRQLSLPEAVQSAPARRGEIPCIIRGGKIANWSFCFEMQSSRGAEEGVLNGLSRDTEAIVLTYAEGLTVMRRHYRGELLEEITQPDGDVKGAGPYLLYESVQASREHDVDAEFEAVFGRIGARLSEAQIMGVLSTACIFRDELEEVAIGEMRGEPGPLGRDNGLGPALGGL
ncbi:hypothetical protein ABZT04_42230 [Streptomyces sp. NPDC005492]|uniref:hypothetical protein n=1 Tax=Streptomyces sp. NPDC005492 TaxID=3156883 RepID=UPI0033AE720C